MKAPQYPHYSKLRNILKEEQLDIYKNLTKKLSIIDSIDFNEVSIIKSSSRVLVMCYRGGIIKVIFAPNNIYKNELYFSHILYPVNIYSLALTLCTDNNPINIIKILFILSSIIIWSITHLAIW